MAILIIEDHRESSELMSYLLSAHGFVVKAAEDGPSGVEMAAAEVPELILCDINLPGFDGFEVARRLRGDERLRGVPLVALTAVAMVGDRERVLAAGFDGYISKPIDPQTLLGEIEHYLKPGRPKANKKQAAESVSPARVPMAKGVILAVDDVASNLDLARSTFEPFGYRVLVAEDTQTALEIARKTRPDLVLSDVNMPEATGMDLALQISLDAGLRGVPVVLISATLPEEESGECANSRGVYKFLRRPIDPGLLVQEIEGVLERAEANE